MVTLTELTNLNMLNQYAKECTRQSHWKESTHRYLANMLVNNVQLRDDVLEGKYKVSPTTNFTINERGHIRHIESPAIRDRIVQKTLTKNVLIPCLIPHIIYDNYASIEQRGTAFARKRFEIMLRKYYMKYGTDGYLLLIDIRKYFDSIDHEVLKQIIHPHIKEQSSDVIELIHYIIDTSSHTDKGLNLGSEAPQIFAIYYLNPLDTFIKIVKGIKYYGRYMDDIFVIGKDKEELKHLLTEIEGVLHGLKLETNKQKTHIVKLTHGFTYLQVKYTLTDTGKIIKQPSHSKIVRERRRLKAFRRMLDAGRMTNDEIYNCYQSWRGTFVIDHNAYTKTLESMDRLFKRLFPNAKKVCKQRVTRNELLRQAMSEACTEDLTQVFNI